jgi:phenylacetic acid degradation protein
MNGIYEFEGLIPVVDSDAYVHPTAVLIGDVIVGPRCYIGPNAVLRGDFGRLVLEEGSNLQDTCVMHGFPDCDTIVEQDGHIGHGAVLHGCRVCRNAMVGMNAVIMDNAVIGEECIVAALAFVKANMQVPPRSLVAGVPGKIVRGLTEQEIEWKTTGTGVYQNLVLRSRDTLRPVEPLRAVEPGRRRLGPIQGLDPLFKLRRQTGELIQS